jgi:single-stranded-DNA-specific exonuclease
MILAARGMSNPAQAKLYLDCNGPLIDPYTMTDMALATGRVALAMERGEKIAIFGDYDVDGITATCLLTDFCANAAPSVYPTSPDGWRRATA